MIKRAMDIVGALVGMALLSPVIAIIAVAVLIKHGRPIVFSQMRPGLYGNAFRLFKFRTMTSERSASGELAPDADRLTRLGRFLRATSLDELPEFWNVLRGDMSLVGPRPLLMEYLPLYSSAQARRHEVRPGITGWAQVNGRNALSWEQKFALDVWYVDNHSFCVDMKVLWLTVWRVLRRDDISADGEATMPRFTGSEQAKYRAQNERNG